MNKEQKVEKKCYVCGFPLEDYPYAPDSHPIFNEAIVCPSCGIHYGYDDGGAGDIIPDELTDVDWVFGDENHKRILKFWRQRWIEQGMKWWSPQPQPEGWDPEKQLKNIPEMFR